MSPKAIAALLLAAASSAATAAGGVPTSCDRPCREHPRLIAPCFTFRGRMNYWNGTPSVRIWRVGTKRILGVSEQRFRLEGICNLPPAIAARLSWDTDLFADFTVCPFTEGRAGEMQLVCVEGATGASVRKADK